MKILLVDDDQLNLNLLGRTLSASGFDDVEFAKSAEEAAQIIAHTNPPFGCMFLDIKMPGSNGDELCRWIRRLPEYQHTPIIMVTALGQKDDIDRAFGAGASDYLTKPLDLAEFVFRVGKIARAVNQPHPRTTKRSDLGETSAAYDRTDFTKPVLLGKIPGEIELSAMEKYLFRLSKSGARDMDAFSFAIKDAAKLHFLCSRTLFTNILQAAGIVIAKHLPAPQHFLAFAGYGAFAGVAQGLGEDEALRDAIEQKVQNALGHVFVPSATGGKIPITPVMSLPIKLDVTHGQNAVDALYKAIVEAEDRSKSARPVA